MSIESEKKEARTCGCTTAGKRYPVFSSLMSYGEVGPWPIAWLTCSTLAAIRTRGFYEVIANSAAAAWTLLMTS